MSRIKGLQNHLENVFEMSSSGLLKKYLGVNFVHVGNKIFMNKKHYIEFMLREFGMYDHKPKKTPMVKGLIVLEDMETKETYVTQYKRMVGKLIYITNSRPDISYVVGLASMFMLLLKIVKHIFKYLKGTMDQEMYRREMTM
jgi:hypothetical protein